MPARTSYGPQCGGMHRCRTARSPAAPRVFPPPPQDADRISRALEDPEFRRLLQQYADEIAQPEVSTPPVIAGRASARPPIPRALRRSWPHHSGAQQPKPHTTPCPQAKAEHEAYLRQLEEEGRAQQVYGARAQLLVAAPALCIKTRRVDSSSAEHNERVYINICTCPKVRRSTVPGQRTRNTRH